MEEEREGEEEGENMLSKEDLRALLVEEERAGEREEELEEVEEEEEEFDPLDPWDPLKPLEPMEEENEADS